MRLARQLLLALWAGGLVSIAALVAPTLFAVLAERALAGQVAGEIFRRATFISIAAALLVVLLDVSGRGRPLWRLLALVPALLLALSEFGVRPELERIRATLGSAAGAFARWHALSAGLYLAATLAVLALLVASLRRP